MLRKPFRDHSLPGGWAGLQWIATTAVVPGDRLACLLHDASDFPLVASWSDTSIDLTRYALGVTHYRDFTIAAGHAWWVDNTMLRNDLAGSTLIVDREWL